MILIKSHEIRWQDIKNGIFLMISIDTKAIFMTNSNLTIFFWHDLLGVKYFPESKATFLTSRYFKIFSERKILSLKSQQNQIFPKAMIFLNESDAISLNTRIFTSFLNAKFKHLPETKKLIKNVKTWNMTISHFVFNNESKDTNFEVLFCLAHYLSSNIFRKWKLPRQHK